VDHGPPPISKSRSNWGWLSCTLVGRKKKEAAKQRNSVFDEKCDQDGPGLQEEKGLMKPKEKFMGPKSQEHENDLTI